MEEMDVANASDVLVMEAQAHSEHSLRDNEITCRNQRVSPLLRLPMEIRERIWTFAFGCRTIHVVCENLDSHRRSKKDSPPRIRFYPCHEYLSEHAMYALSLQGASPDDARIYAASELYNRAWKEEGIWRTIGLAGMHDACVPCCYPKTQPQPFGPPLICKHITREATTPAWRTTSLAFMDDTSLGWFAALAPVRARALVTQLTLIPPGFRYTHQWRNWHASITPAALAALPALAGVHLVLAESVWFPGRGLPPSARPAPPATAADILACFPDAFAHIPGLIRVLARRGLRADRTTVFLPQGFAYRPREVGRVEASGWVGGAEMFVPRDEPHVHWGFKPWRWHLGAGEMVEIAGVIREVLLGGGGGDGEAEEEDEVRMPVFTGDNMAIWGEW